MWATNRSRAPQISRSDLAPPSWQNSMATNCPQLLNPRACRSALCLWAAVSKPVREMSCKICEKMLHTLFKAESSSDSLVFSNSTYQRLSAFFFPQALSTADLIWTKMIVDTSYQQPSINCCGGPDNKNIAKTKAPAGIYVELEFNGDGQHGACNLRISEKAVGKEGRQS